MPDNKKLSISDLRMKTVVLLRLDLMSRSSDLAKMSATKSSGEKRRFRFVFTSQRIGDRDLRPVMAYGQIG